MYIFLCKKVCIMVFFIINVSVPCEIIMNICCNFSVLFFFFIYQSNIYVKFRSPDSEHPRVASIEKSLLFTPFTLDTRSYRKKNVSRWALPPFRYANMPVLRRHRKYDQKITCSRITFYYFTIAKSLLFTATFTLDARSYRKKKRFAMSLAAV